MIGQESCSLGIRLRGNPEAISRYEERIGTRIFVSEIYKDGGFEFKCIDLNESNSAISLDLNMWPNPNLENHIEKHDMVTNYGTTEHLLNRINAFAVAHYLCKAGGIMIHQVPILHYAAHTMCCISPLGLAMLEVLSENARLKRLLAEAMLSLDEARRKR